MLHKVTAGHPPKLSLVEGAGLMIRTGRTLRREPTPEPRTNSDLQPRGEPLNPQEAWARRYMTRAYGPSLPAPVGTEKTSSGRVGSAECRFSEFEGAGNKLMYPAGKSRSVLSRKKRRRWAVVEWLLRP